MIAETHGWFLHRLGEPSARRFLECLDELPRLRVFDADVGLRRRVRAKLDAWRGYKLTYVDAASLVLLHSHRLGTVWGCDAHLGIEGARVVPGPP